MFNFLDRLSRKQKIALFFVLAVVIESVTLPRFFVLSLTPSLDYNLFFAQRKFDHINAGDTVVFMHKDHFTKDNDYRMVKLVGCDEGDTLTVDSTKSYFCNGSSIGKAKDKSRDGEMVQNFVWSGPVPPGCFFPIGTSPHSYDGRYYGFKHKADVLMKARPII